MSDKATETLMRDLARAIEAAIGPKNGFVLLVMPFGAPVGARTNYISNADRRDMIAALKEVTARFEGQALQKGRA